MTRWRALRPPIPPQPMPDAHLLLQPPRQTLSAAAGAWLLPLLILALAAAMAWQDQTVPASLMGAAGGGLIGALLTRRRLAEAALRLCQGMSAGGDGLDGAIAGPGGIAGPPALTTVTELAPLAEGLRRLLARQHSLLEAQTGQLESLREQAHGDTLTGLPNRRHFMATLDAFLSGDAGPVDAGLVLLRLRDLQGMNDRIGHTATDHVLQALGQTLQSYPARIKRCVVGRLNGADFALLLPVGGLAAETALSLIQALRLPLAQIDPAASVAAGAVELQGQLGATQALALADAALARAESNVGGVVVDHMPAAEVLAGEAALGHESWQRRIGRALAEGRVALGAFPVRTADGRQLHLDCPLRVQLLPDGPMEPASRWLAQATRSRLCADVDDSALGLALQAIADDGLARCVNIAAQSVGESDFIAAVSRRLEAAPEAACRLWIDLPEVLALERPLLVRELSRRWRPLGVMLGLEHAGEGLARIPRLIELGLDCVRIDSRFVNHITGPEADGARRYLKGLVSLVQSMGLQVCAEGVRSADDLELLWAMGFDAATGPALVADLAHAD
jgi:diguanylate cyclase (GGDEF)-like protein